MPIEVKLHGNIALGGGPKTVTFEKIFTVTDFPQLIKVNKTASRLRFGGNLSDALTDAGIPNVNSLSYFPSFNEIAYWGGALISDPDKKKQIGILFPKSEESYQRIEPPEGGFSLNPFNLNMKKPNPFGPLLVVNGEVPQADLPEIIEIIGQAYQQFAIKLAAPWN